LVVASTTTITQPPHEASKHGRLRNEYETNADSLLEVFIKKSIAQKHVLKAKNVMKKSCINVLKGKRQLLLPTNHAI
jgi:hypothetical protein